MSRLVLSIALGLAAAAGSYARDGAPDPAFAAVPFDRWLTSGDQAKIHWTLHLSEPALTPHQRLAISLEVQVEGAELVKRRGDGRFLVLLQVNDEKNRAWQTHGEFDLENFREGAKTGDAVFSQSFFAVPGDYRVAVALFDGGSGEHSLVQRTLHVAALKSDPLPEMWRDLPAIEFFHSDSRPDRWYLPEIEGRPKLAVETQHPVEVDLMVNLTPAERLAGSIRAQNRSLQALIPSAKVLTEIEWRNARLNVEWLDLSRRRVAFRQDNVQGLDWMRASAALEKVNPGIIDVRSLANRRFSADFFLNRIARRFGSPGETPRPPRAVIVLSAAVAFEPGMDIHPIGIAPRPDVTLIYIRYQPRPQLLFTPDGQPRRAYGVSDEFEPLLKPLGPRVFEVATPEQFRKSLAQIVELIAKL